MPVIGGGVHPNLELSFPIIDYCEEIACYGCTAGAPIAERKIYEVDQFKKDIGTLYKTLGKKVDRINFTGGDVFLHPHLAELTEYVRKIYPEVSISFSVNGIGFDRQEDSLWERLGKCGLILYWTLYPIDYPDYENTIDKIKRLSKNRVEIFVQGDSAGEGKSSWLIPFCMKEKSKSYDWLFCRMHKDSHNMLIVRDGTIRTCFAVRLYQNLEKRFGSKFTEDFRNIGNAASNVLRIEDIDSLDKVYEFMSKRIPLCDYCALRERHSMGKWMRSGGNISEWMV